MKHCSRCGGEIQAYDATCPHCGRNGVVALSAQILAVILVGLGALVWTGFVPWGEISRRLGLAADDPRGSLILPADRSDPMVPGEIRPTSPGPEPRASAPPAGEPERRPDARSRDATAAPRLASVACQDEAAVARVRSAYPSWSEQDVALVACGRVVEGFTTAHVAAALGSPLRVEQGANQTEAVWVYADRRIRFIEGKAVAGQ